MRKNPKYKGVSTLEILEEARNYNKWIAQTLLSFMKPPVLEVGAGTGNITAHITHVPEFTASEIDIDLVRSLEKKFLKGDISIMQYDITTSPKKFLSNRFKTVFAVNVLEHIDDDRLAVENISKLLRPNGQVLLLVPAKKWAFTKLDAYLGHYRRYEKEELSNLLTKAGFEIKMIHYFNIVGLLSWIIRGGIQRNSTSLTKESVRLFDRVVPLLQRVESFARPPVGISLVCIARKTK